MKNQQLQSYHRFLVHQTSWKMEQSKILIHWSSSDGYEAVAGTWATTKPIDGFDMKATVYGAIDALNTGEMTADQYQKQLVDAWEKLLENVE